MKRLIILVVSVAVLASGAVLVLYGHSASGSAKPAMSVRIVSTRPTTITSNHALVTFGLNATGIVLDAARIGQPNVAGHGHFQLYVDKIPADAYTKQDLQHTWLASLASTSVSLNLPPMFIGGPGKHTILVALAKNDGVLYKVPAASVTITANS